MRWYCLDGLESRLCLASVSGYVYNDLNGNGLHETGESAQPATGITAYLDANNNGQLDDGETSQQTSVRGGKFEFGGLPAGTYTVRLALTSRFKQTDPSDGGRSITVGGDTAGIVEPFGVQSRPRISGFVYNDANHNGARDSGESALLSGRVVYIDSNNNAALDDGEPAFTTNADGFWFDVDPGTYTLRLAPKAGWAQSQPADNAGYTVTVPNPAAVEQPRLYFGTYEEAPHEGRIYGILFNDANGNGVRENDESGVAGKQVFLDANGNDAFDAGEASFTTTSTGAFSFGGLTAGVYHVRTAIPAGFTQTTPIDDVTLTPNQVVVGANIGIHANEVPHEGRIYGTYFVDANSNGVLDSGEAPVAGKQVFLDANGNDAFDAGETSFTTTSTGAYGFGGLTAGTYHVRAVVPPGFILTTNPADVTLAANQVVQGVNIGIHAREVPHEGRIYGRYFVDANGNAKADSGEAPVAGKVVFLDLNGNNALDAGEASYTTTSTGAFAFGGLTAGTYHVRAVIPGGFKQTTPLADVTLASNQVVNDVIIGIRSTEPVRTGSITGISFADLNGDGVRQAGEPVQVGKTIFIDANKNGVLDTGEKSTLTNGEGRYTFANLPAGTYRIRRVVPTGYRLTTPAAGYYDVTLATGQTVGEKNFGTTERGLVGGRVFSDNNGDKTRNDGEAGLVGWVVYIDANKNGKLDDAERRTTTAGGGEWVFRDLIPGTYRVRVQGKDGYKLTTPGDGFFDITVASGGSKTGYAFGEKPITAV